MSSFGQRLSSLRADKGLSQSELATRLNISKSALAMYEIDKREPGFETINRIADFFDVSVDYLMGREVSEEVDPLDDPRRNIQFKGWDKLTPEDQEEIKAFFRAKIMIREAEERKKRITDKKE